MATFQLSPLAAEFQPSGFGAPPGLELHTDDDLQISSAPPGIHQATPPGIHQCGPPGVHEVSAPPGFHQEVMVPPGLHEEVEMPPPGLSIPPGVNAKSKMQMLEEETQRLMEENLKLANQRLELESARLAQENAELKAKLFTKQDTTTQGPPGSWSPSGPPGMWASFSPPGVWTAASVDAKKASDESSDCGSTTYEESESDSQMESDSSSPTADKSPRVRSFSEVVRNLS